MIHHLPVIPAQAGIAKFGGVRGPLAAPALAGATELFA